MAKYLLKRLLHGALSIIAVVAVVMILIYSLMDRELLFANDSAFNKLQANQKITYKYRKWEEYGYLDYVPYADYLMDLMRNGEIDESTRAQAVKFGKTPGEDSAIAKEYVTMFTEYYQSKGYRVERLDAKMTSKKKIATGGQQQLFAYKDKPLLNRLWTYFTGIFSVDNIHKVQEDIGDRGLTFTWKDPAYGGDTFAPAILGNGTRHKYLLYFDWYS